MDVNEEVRAYVDAIPAEHRPLFDRVDRLVRQACPEASVGISYGMPTYRVGRRRLHLGVWSHGVSLYGWQPARNADFTARHPELLSGKATLRIRPEDAAAIPDDELTELVAQALSP
ncbi:iron chaperone [Streptantibioticus parmotrematis]|uniref:iron chaperone n=1 Tax=Streptantibioticus parmotrematis TaxID=2873249 RepID=UPI0027E0213B|nr:DUF1801 domain-containing protein [Streptantibioticus parmotrematis]